MTVSREEYKSESITFFAFFLISRFLPEDETLVWVGGSSSFDRRWVDETRKIRKALFEGSRAVD
jgi:hypothetical protein